MSFALPDQQYSGQRTDVEAMLRDIEQNCPKTTPREVRAALIAGAEEIKRWRLLAQDTARQLEEAANVRISEMATTSQANEIQRGVKQTMLDLAVRFRELA
jgi:hypothetical protein